MSAADFSVYSSLLLIITAIESLPDVAPSSVDLFGGRACAVPGFGMQRRRPGDRSDRGAPPASPPHRSMTLMSCSLNGRARSMPRAVAPSTAPAGAMVNIATPSALRLDDDRANLAASLNGLMR